MKKALLIAAALVATSVQAQDKELTPRQKLFVGEAVTALVTGPIVLPVALATGRGAELCTLLEGRWVKPSSYDPNSDGRDQCPKGNWLRVIPFLADHIAEN